MQPERVAFEDAIHIAQNRARDPMTAHAATVADPEGELRWRNWQARAARADRRMAKRMRGLMILIAAAFLAWFVVGGA